MPVTDVRITEIMYNPAGGTDTAYEFLEITNTGTETFNISNWQIGNSDFIPEVFLDVSGGAIFLAAGETAVIAPSGTTQSDFESLYGPLPAGTVYINASPFGPNGGTLNLSNSGGVVTLISGFDGPADSAGYPDIAEGTPGAELSVGITFDPLGNQIFTAQTPNPGVGAAVAPPSGPTDGDDVIVGADEPTTLDLLDGNDTWTGQDDPALFALGQFTDTIYGNLGNDSIYSGIGNDKIYGGRDDDLLDLGDGNDNAWGGEGNDELFGGTGLDRLNGNSGDDSLFGGNGGDILRGGKGEDYIEGGQGSDIINGGNQSDEIYGGTGNDRIIGGNGADLIDGGSGSDSISGGNMDDVIHGGHGNDRVNGGNGNDQLFGGKSDDVLFGARGRDEVYGGAGQDRVHGGDGDDIVDGGSQSDRMFGGNGDDIMFGGRGDDVMFGGADADTFVFAGVVNHDRINDFEVGVDQIDLTAYGPVSVEEALAAISQTANGALIDLGGNGSVLLRDVAVTDLTLDDFIFIPDIIEVG